MSKLFDELQAALARPDPFSVYGAAELWTDEHISARMLACHLDPESNVSSRRRAFIDASADWIIDRFRLDETKQVADFGCGPGLYTTRLATSGARVTGVDFSERSIHHARALAEEKGLSVEHVLTDYRTFKTPERFHLVTLIMCDFCVLDPTARQDLLRRIRRLLEPGGLALFDVSSIHAYDARVETATMASNLMDGFWSAAPYVGLHVVHKYPAEKVVLDKYTIVEKGHTRVFHNWLQHFTPESLEQELATAGWRIVECLGDVSGSPFDLSGSEFAVVVQADVS